MVAVPVAADIRRARSAVARGMRPVLRRARGPALVALGAGELTGSAARSLSRAASDPDPDETASTRSSPRTTGELRERGEIAWGQLLERPAPADLLSRGALLAAELAQWVEDTTDELHDRSQEILARLDNSLSIRRRE